MPTKRRPSYLVGATHFSTPERGVLEIGYRTGPHGRYAINELTEMALDRITPKKLIPVGKLQHCYTDILEAQV